MKKNLLILGAGLTGVYFVGKGLYEISKDIYELGKLEGYKEGYIKANFEVFTRIISRNKNK